MIRRLYDFTYDLVVVGMLAFMCWANTPTDRILVLQHATCPHGAEVILGDLRSPDAECHPGVPLPKAPEAGQKF